jgi:hypothetical protein
MSGRNKYGLDFLRRIFRYHSNSVSGEERNSLERELQRDPFAEEAAEGYTHISQDEAQSDINELRKRLNKRSSRKSIFIYYRIAASVAVLVILSAIYLFIGENNRLFNSSDKQGQAITLEIAKNQPILNEEQSNTNDLASGAAEKKIAAPLSEKSKKEEEALSLQIEADKINERQKSEAPPVVDVTPSAVYKDDRRLAVSAAEPAAARSLTGSKPSYNLTGKITSSEDNLALPGVSVRVKGGSGGTITDIAGNYQIPVSDSSSRTLVASSIGMDSKEFEARPNNKTDIILNPSELSLSEVVVVGYGTKNKDSADEQEQGSEHVAPQPAGGKSVFNSYVRNNLHRPDTSLTGRRIVVLSFIVRKDGSIDNISVIKTPGKIFTDEAIRVLKAGPSWNPAEMNGNSLDEEVRLRIVFK